MLRWAADSIDRLAVATSFQASGLVILHLLRGIKPDLPVLFLDTGFHFEETLEFRQRIAELWDLKVVDLRGEHGDAQRQAQIYGGTAGIAYDPCYHQACDTINNLSTAALNEMSDAAFWNDQDHARDIVRGWVAGCGMRTG